MNSSRFGGFRTADGASQASKNHQGLATHAKVSMAGEDVMGLMNNAGGYHGDKVYVPASSQHQHGPQSPQSNQSFHANTNVENRRARPKIVKTSHDHGNMFFIQQANSLKNSSQIAQRKDIAGKVILPIYAVK